MRLPQLFLDCIWLDKFSSIAWLFRYLFVETFQLRQPHRDVSIFGYFLIFIIIIFGSSFSKISICDSRNSIWSVIFIWQLLTSSPCCHVIVFTKLIVDAVALASRFSFLLFVMYLYFRFNVSFHFFLHNFDLRQPPVDFRFHYIIILVTFLYTILGFFFIFRLAAAASRGKEHKKIQWLWKMLEIHHCRNVSLFLLWFSPFSSHKLELRHSLLVFEYLRFGKMFPIFLLLMELFFIISGCDRCNVFLIVSFFVRFPTFSVVTVFFSIQTLRVAVSASRYALSFFVVFYYVLVLFFCNLYHKFRFSATASRFVLLFFVIFMT